MAGPSIGRYDDKNKTNDERNFVQQFCIIYIETRHLNIFTSKFQRSECDMQKVEGIYINESWLDEWATHFLATQKW